MFGRLDRDRANRLAAISCLAFALIAALAGSCGGGALTKPDELQASAPVEPGAPIVAADRRVRIEAATGREGERAVGEPLVARLPAKIRVTEGNAGRGRLRLSLDAVACEYRGGAHRGRSVERADSTDVERGRYFRFHRCFENGRRLDGLEAGDDVRVARSIRVGIEATDPPLFARVVAVLRVGR